MLNLFLALIFLAIATSVMLLIWEHRDGLRETEERSEEVLRSERRRGAKQFNERLKLLGTFINGIGVAALVTSVITPLALRTPLTVVGILLGLVSASSAHLLAQMVLLFWKNED